MVFTTFLGWRNQINAKTLSVQRQGRFRARTMYSRYVTFNDECSLNKNVRDTILCYMLLPFLWWNKDLQCHHFTPHTVTGTGISHSSLPAPPEVLEEQMMPSFRCLLPGDNESTLTAAGGCTYTRTNEWHVIHVPVPLSRRPSDRYVTLRELLNGNESTAGRWNSMPLIIRKSSFFLIAL